MRLPPRHPDLRAEPTSVRHLHTLRHGPGPDLGHRGWSARLDRYSAERAASGPAVTRRESPARSARPPRSRSRPRPVPPRGSGTSTPRPTTASRRTRSARSGSAPAARPARRGRRPGGPSRPRRAASIAPRRPPLREEVRPARPTRSEAVRRSRSTRSRGATCVPPTPRARHRSRCRSRRTRGSDARLNLLAGEAVGVPLVRVDDDADVGYACGSGRGNRDVRSGLLAGARRLPEHHVATAGLGEDDLRAVLPRPCQHQVDRGAATDTGADACAFDHLRLIRPLADVDGVAEQRLGPRPGTRGAEHQPNSERHSKQVGQRRARVRVEGDEQLLHATSLA